MTDNTHEAPERIFATGNATTGSWNATPVTFRGPVEIEYIRADVVEAMVARAIVADRIEELEAKLAWQPIETAPKDGTEIIVGASLPWHGWRCDMVAWDKNRTMWWDNNGLPYQPTHWMSLPAPPSQN